MKIARKLGIIALTTGILFGCGISTESNAESQFSKGFEIISKDEIDKGNVYVLRHKVTKCYSTYTTSIYSNAFAPDVEPMYVKENGVTVPYCD